MTTFLEVASRKGWAITGPSLLFVLCLVCFSTVVQADETGLITPQDTWERAQEDELLIIDIRTQGEWEETGIPPDAALVSLYSDWGVPNLDFVVEILEAANGDRNRPIALICAGGVRTAFAADLLRDRGFTQVLDVGEGMLGSGDGPGWIARGLPTEPCSECS